MPFVFWLILVTFDLELTGQTFARWAFIGPLEHTNVRGTNYNNMLYIALTS